MLAYKKLEFFTLFPHCILSLYDPTYFQDQKKSVYPNHSHFPFLLYPVARWTQCVAAPE